MDLKNIQREDSCKISKKVNNGSFSPAGELHQSVPKKQLNYNINYCTLWVDFTAFGFNLKKLEPV